MWVRGLKLCRQEREHDLGLSHPVWVRGLKQRVPQRQDLPFHVAPRVGAWIETGSVFAFAANCSRRTPCGCVD